MVLIAVLVPWYVFAAMAVFILRHEPPPYVDGGYLLILWALSPIIVPVVVIAITVATAWEYTGERWRRPRCRS